MTVSRVQGAKTGTSSSSSSLSLTLDSTPTEGNLLIAVIGVNNSPYRQVSSISESNVTWTKQKQKQLNDEANLEIWAGVVGSSPSANITINFSETANKGIAHVCEYSGLLTSSFLDQTAENNGTGTSTDTGTTSTTTVNDEVWIGGIYITWCFTQSNPTNSFSLLAYTYNVPANVSMLEKIVSATGTANSGTTGSDSNWWLGIIATFKGAEAPPSSLGGLANKKLVLEL